MNNDALNVFLRYALCESVLYVGSREIIKSLLEAVLSRDNTGGFKNA
jgi:hypothetical protein